MWIQQHTATFCTSAKIIKINANNFEKVKESKNDIELESILEIFLNFTTVQPRYHSKLIHFSLNIIQSYFY